MLLLLLFMWMFWYAMHLKLFWAFLWCMWVEVQVLSLFKTVASNHKTITYITLLKVVLLYEGSSCITLQHLLICTKKHIWKFKNPCFFPHLPGLLALLPTRLWPSVMRSQMTAKGWPFLMLVSLLREWARTKTRWWLYSHFNGLIT